MSDAGHPFVRIYDLFRRYRWAAISLLIIVPALALWSLQRIRLVEDISEVLPSGGNVRLISKALNASSLSNRIVFSVIPKKDVSTEALINASDSLAASLASLSSEYNFDINYIQDDMPVSDLFDFYRKNLPYYFTESDYLYLDSALQEERLKDILSRNYDNLISPAGMGLKRFLIKDPLHLATRKLQALQNLQLDEQYSLIEGRIVSDSPNHLIFFIQPSTGNNESDVNKELFESFNAVLNGFMLEYPDFEVIYFSGSRVATANAIQVKKDVYLTVSIALVMLLLLIGTYFKSPLAVFRLFIPLLLAGLTAVVVLSFVRHEISIIALGVGSVLLGISIDFAVHLQVHLQHSGGIRHSISELSPSIWMSSLTTALAFLCLAVINSEAITDLAYFAAISILSSAFFTIVVLPQFLQETTSVRSGRHLIDRLASLRPEKSVWLALILFSGIMASLPFADKVQFNENLMELNFMPDDLEKTEKRMNELSPLTRKNIFLFSSGESSDLAVHAFEQQRPLLESLTKAGLIDRYINHSALLISEELATQRMNRWKTFWAAREGDWTSTFKKVAIETGYSESAFNDFLSTIQEVNPLDREQLGILAEKLSDNYRIEQDGRHILVTLIKTSPENRKAFFKAANEAENNIITDQQHITAEFVGMLKAGFDKFVKLSLLAVFCLLWIFYGRIEMAVVTFLPIAGGWSMTLALMHFFNIRFNIFNVMLASFVFGLGVDYCIFITRGLQQKLKFGKDNLKAYRSSIYLSGFTTIIGTGVLIFAKHPAIHSLAFIAIFGIGAVLLLANTIQPFLFNWMMYHSSGKLRARPVTLLIMINTSIVYGIFIIGTVFLFLLRLVFFITPLPVKTKKYIFHVLICWLNRCVLKSVFYIYRSHIDKQNADFNKPAIVIANHQSFADILFSLSLHPKLLLQTKDWVWNNPLLKLIIRFADCYPISYGYDQNLGLIKERMKEGYSMLIYPEGSRSADLEIKRFHKGAFFMANELEADIQPIIYHGVGFMMPKHEPFLYSDGMNIKYLPRIKHDDPEFGTDYQSRTKAISKYMRDEYRKLRETFEGPKYFRRKLISRYIYKGPVIEWYVRIKLRSEDYYQFFHDHLPTSGMIYDVGCGLGMMCNLLKYVSPERHLIGVDYDEEKIGIAANAEPRPGLEFHSADVRMFNFTPADGFVISDVLHYLTPDNQEALLRKCLDKLNPGGSLILKDADASKQRRHLGTRISELFSTRLGFNKTANKLVFMDDQFYSRMFADYPVTIDKLEASRFTSNQVYVIRKNKTS